jgi:hypothetical protein
MKTVAGLLVVGVLAAVSCGSGSDEVSEPATTSLLKNAVLTTSTSTPSTTTTQAPTATTTQAPTTTTQVPTATTTQTPTTPTWAPTEESTTTAAAQVPVVDEEAVLAFAYEWGPSEESAALQTHLGITTDGWYGPATQAAHIAELEARGLSTENVPNRPPSPTTSAVEETTDTPAAPTTTNAVPAMQEVSVDAKDDILIVGLNYTVEASGFLPDSTVEVELHSDPHSFGTWIVDVYGRIKAQIRLPPTTGQGQHRLVVREHITAAQATIRSALRTEIPVVVTVDETGPVFGSASVSVDSVDVTDGAQTIDLSFTATDDLSGVAVVNFTLSGDAGWSKAVAIEGTCIGCALAYLTSGTIQDGTWTATVEIPGGLASQTVAVLMPPGIRDAAGNYSGAYSPATTLPPGTVSDPAVQVATFNITNSGG